MMVNDQVFRLIFILFTMVMVAVRVYYQRKAVTDRNETAVKGNPLGLIPGAIAALTVIVFGLEYIFFPGVFGFAYLVAYPYWLRWLGVVSLGFGSCLLWVAHYHLDRSFSSFVALKEEQVLVDSGPYRYIRHPIYTAYIMNYMGGGLLAANVILTFVPVVSFALMIAYRIPEEEAMLLEAFGTRYQDYMAKTKRLLPFLW